ncbi:MAG: ABC transporter substrate-binding protein [Methylobacteriaceae bacterium]|nr:ABC transporter substrate-binding protein [Methylobacteriaceae bacterium]
MSGLLLAAGITGALAQTPAPATPPLKLGYILDMSGLYADITGIGSVEAARMAVDDFGGTVLGRKVEVVYADHQNKADIAGAQARDFFDNQGVEAILDVAASATALAANEVAKQRASHLRAVAHDQRAGLAQQARKLVRTVDETLIVMHGEIAAKLVDGSFVHELADNDVAQSSLQRVSRGAAR